MIGVFLAVQKKRAVIGDGRMSDFDRMDEVVSRKPTVHAMAPSSTQRPPADGDRPPHQQPER